MEHWGKRLSFILKEKEISQSKAADIVGIRKSVLNGWTTGVSPSNLAAVHRLCEALDISFTWLLIGTEPKHESTLKVIGDFEKEFCFDGYGRIRIDAISKGARK
jgi:transcriptional regulator with XRE-family HTH domain